MAGSLTDRMRRGAIAFDEWLVIGEAVLSALSAAHRAGVVHRDVKPQNVLVGSFGQIKVCDFGISGIARDDGMTQTNASTLAYASPEELDGSGLVGPPADIYSFSVMMVHLLTGRRPSFRAREEGDLELPPVLVRDHAQLAAMLERALATRPERRPTADELAAAFRAASMARGARNPGHGPSPSGGVLLAPSGTGPPDPTTLREGLRPTGGTETPATAVVSGPTPTPAPGGPGPLSAPPGQVLPPPAQPGRQPAGPIGPPGHHTTGADTSPTGDTGDTGDTGGASSGVDGGRLRRAARDRRRSGHLAGRHADRRPRTVPPPRNAPKPVPRNEPPSAARRASSVRTSRGRLPTPPCPTTRRTIRPTIRRTIRPTIRPQAARGNSRRCLRSTSMCSCSPGRVTTSTGRPTSRRSAD